MSSDALQGLLAAVGAVLTANVTSKLFLVFCLFVAGLGAFRASPVGGFVPRASAAALYVANPFTYGRLSYGQLYLIAGYSLLPWVAGSLRELIDVPHLRQAISLGIMLAVLGVLDLHLLIPATALIVCTAIAKAAAVRSSEYLRRLLQSLVAVGLLTLITSSYWAIPLVLGSSIEGHLIGRMTTGDVTAFATTADPSLGLLPNVLGLYGFWAEDTGRFPSLKSYVAFWPLCLIALITVIALGVIRALSAHESEQRRLRPWLIGLIGTGVVSVLLGIGVADSRVAQIINLLDHFFSAYRGMRDAGKWGALMAVIYAQLLPVGVAAVLTTLETHLKSPVRRESAIGVMAAVALALPLYYGNGLLFGMHGQIEPADYPRGWYAANEFVSTTGQGARTLFLPWHGYFSLSFVRNANNVIANPAPDFFTFPILASTDLEIQGVSPPADPDQRAITQMIQAGADVEWAPVLASHGIRYVLLAREADWQTFQADLDGQVGLVLVRDYGSIEVFGVNLTPG